MIMTSGGLDDRIKRAHENPKTSRAENPAVVSTSSSRPQSDPRPLLVLINPKSGRGRSLKIFRKHVTKFLNSHKIDHEVFVTRADFRVKDYLAPKSTAELIPYRALIVVSGDGLVFELVNAIMTRSDWQQIMTLPIAIIPTGSGNGLAYTLIGQSKARVKSQKEAVNMCCEQIVQDETCLSDLVKITYNDGKATVWSFLSIGWGLLANIDVDSDWLRRLGELRFTIYGLIRSLTSVSYKGRLSFKPDGADTCYDSLKSESNSNSGMYNCIHADSSHSSSPSTTSNEIFQTDKLQIVDSDMDSDEEGWIHIEDKFACLYAVHQSHISRTTQFAPKSTPSDGLIYLTYVRGKLNPCQVVQFLLSIEDASHEHLSYVKVVPVRKFKFQPLEPGKIVVDGEKIDWNVYQGPLTAEVMPKAMKLIWANIS